MSSTYQTVIACLHKQMQTIPAPPAEQSDYEVWARSFLKTLVGHCFASPFRCLLIIQVAFNYLAEGGTVGTIIIPETVEEVTLCINNHCLKAC